MRLKGFKIKLFLIFTACFVAVLLPLTLYAVFPCKYKSEVYSIVDGTNIPPQLTFAIIKAESSFKKDKISSKGAVGLMQIMPDTANYVSKLFFGGEDFDLFCPKDNILYGVTYLLYLFKKFPDQTTALCAYNAGEGNVQNWLKEKAFSSDGKSLDKIPFEETRTYVERVTLYAKIYKVLYFLD